MQIVLASGSKYKRQLIEKLGLAVTSHAPDINETPNLGETPADLTQRLSIDKARAIACEYPHALIIGSDQVAHHNGQVLGKPGNFYTAKQQLQTCSGKSVRFLTGLCLLNTSTSLHHYMLCQYDVAFRTLTDAQITHYLHTEAPYDCAGSFKSEGLGIALFEHIRGDDPNSLIGLPLIALTQLLLQEGIDVLAPP